MEAICANMALIVSKLSEISTKVDNLSSRLASVELNQRNLTTILLKRRAKRKNRVEKRAPQNLGCVKYERNFVEAKFHPNRELRLKATLERLDASYQTYLNSWLKIPQNQSFYRQSRAHSYTYSKTRGWERVKASYLLEKLTKITRCSFRHLVMSLNKQATSKHFKFKFPKARVIRVLLGNYDALKKSKDASRPN